MFQVYLELIQQACEELERQLKLFQRNAGEVRRVIRVLKTMKGFEDQIDACKRELRQMEDEQEFLTQMLKGLGNVLMMYRNYENRIIASGEDGLVQNREMMVGMVELNTSAVSGWDIKLY